MEIDGIVSLIIDSPDAIVWYETFGIGVHSNCDHTSTPIIHCMCRHKIKSEHPPGLDSPLMVLVGGPHTCTWVAKDKWLSPLG